MTIPDTQRPTGWPERLAVATQHERSNVRVPREFDRAQRDMTAALETMRMHPRPPRDPAAIHPEANAELSRLADRAFEAMDFPGGENV